MSQTHDLNVIESELSISQQINWILDNIYQNYKQGFNTLKEVLILVKNGHNIYDKYQLDHYNNVIDSVEKNIALWENQYEMFDVKHKTETFNQKEVIETIDYQKEIIDQNIDVKTFMNSETVDTCQHSQHNFSVNQSQTTDTFDNEWYNTEDIYYMKALDVLTPSSMEQIINTTIRDDIIDSGFEESPLSVTNCDEINSFVLTNLCHDLDSKQDVIEENYISSNSYESIESTEHLTTNNVNLKKRSHNYIRKSRQVDTRIWYKCGWDGCSFGSFYNGVVKRHSYKKHSGKIKIDKSNNSAMHRFKCDWPGCEVSLVAYHKLVEHKRKHTGEKPFKCKWRACNYATARLYSMIIHERTHKLDPNLTLDYNNNK